jgi:predicted restriction endonuclease
MDNTVYLCPNHHKLLDYDLLTKEDLALLENKILIMLRKSYKRNSKKQYEYLLYLLKLK